MYTLLKTSFGDGGGKDAAQAKLRNFKQHNKLLADFLPEWMAIAEKTGYNDEALIAQLKFALHPDILMRISFLPTPNGPLTYDAYLAQVRTCDSILSALNPNYTKAPAHQAAAAAAHTTPVDFGDPMDLSMLWTAKDIKAGRRPKTAVEKAARVKYCKDNDLCMWCCSDKHFAGTCADAPWNKKNGGKKDSGEGKA